jgi:hypothetical protein
MFHSICDKNKKIIKYDHFFKYVIGEILDFKAEEKNT